MKTNFLTHIVPTLPPQAGDAGDYALDLARLLRDQHGVNGQFILCDPDWDGPSRMEGFFIRRLRVQNEASLWGLLSSLKKNPSVLLHYDGHGYNKNGIPSWLFRGIKSWLAEHGGPVQSSKKISTVFHELWTLPSKPWEGNFFRRSLQKNLVKKLHHLSRVSIANTQHAKSMLDDLEPNKALWFPSPENMPKTVPPDCTQEEPKQISISSGQWREPHADWKIIAQKYLEILLPSEQTGPAENLRLNPPVRTLSGELLKSPRPLKMEGWQC